MQAQDTLHFWFEALTPRQHCVKNAVAPTSNVAALALLAEPGPSF